MDCEVLIVGAGPTGLVLALELALRGVRARVVDRSPGAGAASRAMAVHARTLEFYRRLDLSDEIVRRGIKVEKVHLREGGREVACVKVGDFGRGLSPFPFVLSFPQDEHEKVLGERLREAGVEVEWNTELVGFREDGNRVSVTLRKDGRDEAMQAGWLCGCDGARSAVREGLGIRFPGGTYKQLFYVADVEASGVATDGDLNLCFGTSLFCAVFPIRTTGRFRLIGFVPEELRGDREITLDAIRPYVEKLIGIRLQQERWFSSYQVHHRVAEHFRSGRVFLSGDAGHVHSPAGGQGMNTGIGDAVNLAWKLAAVVQQRATAAILDTYEPERIAFARMLVSTTDFAFTGIVDPHLRGTMIRRVVLPHLFPRLLGFDRIRRFAFRTLSQTRIHYRESGLSGGKAGTIRGGDRLPWVEVSDNFAVLRSLDWQIHVHGVALGSLRTFAATNRIPLHVFDWNDDATRAGLARNAAYLVRPDGHVAVASARQDIAEMQALLDRFGISMPQPGATQALQPRDGRS